MGKNILRLYITGKTPSSQKAIRDLRRICRHELGDRYEVEVIDVLDRPQIAENQKIIATPTLIKELPVPIRRIIGDLSDAQKVLLGLDIRSCGPRRNECTASGGGKGLIASERER